MALIEKAKNKRQCLLHLAQLCKMKECSDQEVFYRRNKKSRVCPWLMVCKLNIRVI